MMITRVPMGETPQGEQVYKYTLPGAAGAFAEISTLGGCILSVHVPDRGGAVGDVTLGYTDVESMRRASGYMGFLIGRYANRIGGAAFELNGKRYALCKNDGENALHGGAAGFDKKVWSDRTEGETLVLTLESPDGEEGYPGALAVTVRYEMRKQNTLSIAYEAACDADTILNLTNHVYFNLSGPACPSIGAHAIQINADRFTEVSSPACIPTGRLVPVAGTPLDLRAPVVIGEGLALEAGCEQMRFGKGYDHNFAINGFDGTLRQAAVLTDAATGRRMETWTDQPGVQLYSGNMISGDTPGKRGVPYVRRQGLCLETQRYPDSIHHPHFPSCMLRKGETFRSVTEYRFTAE